jgi:hypothetical protein
MTETPGDSSFIIRLDEGEQVVTSIETLDRILTQALQRSAPEVWLSPASPARQLGSLALRVFGLKPRPAVVVHFGVAGAMVTFRDRNGGDYRVVNREFDGQSTRAQFRLHDGRRLSHRLDEVLPNDEALDFVRDFFREGDRPWRISCRPVTL